MVNLKHGLIALITACSIATFSFTGAMAVTTPGGGSAQSSAPTTGTEPDNGGADGGKSAADQILKGSNDVGGKENSNVSLTDFIQSIINILLFLIGAVAVIMIVIGGIKYTTSNGDPGTIKSAKDTILYAVIGLVVAILAYAIVNFVVSSLIKKP